MSELMQSDQEKTIAALKGWQWIRTQHGSLFDRGAADSYYHRGPRPHYGGVGGDSGPRITVEDRDSVNEYLAGYDYNEEFGDKKEW